jgi:hypothetical protein
VSVSISDQFDEIVERTSQELSFKGLKEFVLQQGDITITQAEVDEALAKNPNFSLSNHPNN